MQRLRGKVYGVDGAIHPAELTADGRHKQDVDEMSWHVVSLDARGEVVACLRYLEESQAPGFSSLRVRHAAVARCPVEGSRFRRAVEREMSCARSSAVNFGEVGGWAVCQNHRGTTESLRILLATYGLLELLGSCLGVATATFRHGSAGILQRIGLTSLRVDGQDIPPYYDSQYGCMMQVLHFDSRSPNPKYRQWIADLMADLADAPVFCREQHDTVFSRMWRGLEKPGFVGQAEPVSIGG